MDTIKFEKGSVRVIAHRGLSGIEVENTNSAFVAAGNRSYYGIETDIHRTLDGHFIIGHDDSYKRISGEEAFLEKETLSALQDIIFFDKDGTKKRADLRPAILENYISICKKYEKHSVLELKSDFTPEEIKRIIDILKEQDYLKNVTFISFNYDNLLRIKSILPEHSVQYLFWEITEELAKRLVNDKIDVDVYYKALTKENIDMLHRLGLRINCWTVDDKADAERLSLWGVDFITSNILE